MATESIVAPEADAIVATPVGPPASAQHVTPPAGASDPPATPPTPRWQWALFGGLAIAALAAGVVWGVPWIDTALNTVSTDDAYVNSHVTLVAPRVPGQVARVLVDNNNRVKKGQLLVELDKKPYEIQVAIKQAALKVAQTDLAVAKAQVQAQAALMRSNRYNLQHTIELVHNQIALLRSNVAQFKVEETNLQLAERDYVRNKPLLEKGAITQAEFDQFAAKRDSARSRMNSAEAIVQQTRAGLGLPINHANPLDVPENWAEDYSQVRQALLQLAQSTAAFGYTFKSWDVKPKEAIEDFLKQDPEGNLDRIYARLMAEAPAILQAQAKVDQAQRDLDQADLDLKYCDIVSEIDGVVTRRSVNPGNNVQVGQALMAVRSLTEIWIDANFKETQLGDLRIGQRVVVETDMYGSREKFEGRITGFTMGTGQTLALLPPQNATGNFVKIVQRLPVRIDLTDYDPEKTPLFVGLSVTPYVHYKEPATGEHAGEFLQAAAKP